LSKNKSKEQRGSEKPKQAFRDRIFDPEHAGTDPSFGKGNEIHGASIESEEEVLEIVCPKGVSEYIRRELMEKQ
jgi:hypothetical protein